MSTHNTREIEEIAQYVIDNRYPKSEQEKVSDSELYQYILDGFHQELQKALKEKDKECGQAMKDFMAMCHTAADVELQKAREREAYLWFENWYSHYKAPLTAESNQDFGKWATERLQTLGADQSELDQDK